MVTQTSHLIRVISVRLVGISSQVRSDASAPKRGSVASPSLLPCMALVALEQRGDMRYEASIREGPISGQRREPSSATLRTAAAPRGGPPLLGASCPHTDLSSRMRDLAGHFEVLRADKVGRVLVVHFVNPCALANCTI